MKILKEKEVSLVQLDCEFNEEEKSMLLNYAIKNISRSTCVDRLVEWAFVDILTKQVKSAERKKKK